MEGKRFLLFKISVVIMACVCLFGGSLLWFDNIWLQRIILGGFVTGVCYCEFMPPIRAYRRDDIAVVYRGFHFTSGIFLSVVWAGCICIYFFYKANIGILFAGLSCGLVCIAVDMRVIIFDYYKGVVIGLYEDAERKMSRLTIGHITEGEDRIRIGRENGFFLDKKDFSENNWQQLLSNLERTRDYDDWDDDLAYHRHRGNKITALMWRIHYYFHDYP